MLFDLVGTACRFGCTTPVTTPESVAQTSGSGDSIMWPLFLLALFAVVSWKLWKYARRNLVKLPKDWETQFWLDFDNWRGDPLNR